MGEDRVLPTRAFNAGARQDWRSAKREPNGPLGLVIGIITALLAAVDPVGPAGA